MTNIDDPQSLAERFNQGDETALVEMYARYAGPMYATALNLSGQREIAAEAVQQAFIQAWRSASRFDTAKDLQPWLYAITRRTVIDAYRRTQRAADTMSFDMMDDLDVATPPLCFDDAWQKWEVRRALTQLPPDELEVLRLAYFVSMTQAEISRHLNIPLGTVKSRSARALRRLGGLLSHLYSDSHVEA